MASRRLRRRQAKRVVVVADRVPSSSIREHGLLEVLELILMKQFNFFDTVCRPFTRGELPEGVVEIVLLHWHDFQRDPCQNIYEAFNIEPEDRKIFNDFIQKHDFYVPDQGRRS